MADTTDVFPVAERVKGAMMFIGRREDSRVWVRVDTLPNDGEPFPDDNAKQFSFDTDIVSGARPGQCFDFEFSPDGKHCFYFAPKRGKPSPHVYRGGWKNLSDCARWRAEHEANEAVRMAEERMRKDGGRVDLEPLADLRATYKKLPAPARAQLLAQIVAYIVR